MSKQTINIGASPNDGTGTPLRTSFDYTNQNFTELYTALGGGVGLPGATTQVIFNDGGTNLAGDAGLVYNKTTDTLTAGNASITGALGAAGLNVTGATIPANGVYLGSANNLSFSAASTLGMTLNSTGLGIGATPAERLTIGSTTAANYIKLTNSGAATGLLIGSFNTAVDIKNREVGAINLFTSDTQRMVISATGDVTISTGNVVMGTSGKGIDFSATASGSGTMTSELLNDYEEGTFTPTIGGTATYTAQAGVYTKVGRLVTASFDITILLSGTGDIATVSGLPFAASANVGAAVAVSYFSGLATSAASIYGYVNTSAMAFNTIAAGGGTSPSGAVVITNGTRLAGTAVYMV